jgi:hypothetical protein
MKTCVQEIENHQQHTANTIILNKLNALYNAEMLLPNSQDKFLNLSHHQVSPKEKEVLNMGLNCHLQSKFDPVKKKMEMELLYDATLKLQKENKITIDPGFSDALRNESHKHRAGPYKGILTKEHRDACKSLRNNRDLIIRKADKSNTYVLMNLDDYKSKLNLIMEDDTKFEKIRSNPVEKLKTKINQIVIIFQLPCALKGYHLVPL